jgi:hypothetical protein
MTYLILKKGEQNVNNKTISGIILVFILINILTLTFNLVTVQAFSEPIIFVDPAACIVDIDEIFTVNINVENVADLISYESKLGFNKTILEPIAVEEGSFIREQTPSPLGTFFLSIIEDDFVHVACVTLGNYSGVSGSGSLFNVTFNATKTGTSNLHLYDSILLDSSVTQIVHDPADGEVLVTMPGDVNNDGVVNVLDLTIVSLSYGTFEGEPDYNPDADINEDGIVDMRDLAKVARNLV